MLSGANGGNGESRLRTEEQPANESRRAGGNATGRNVRTLTSGIISSMANSTPPIGVLNVAAMPAPAPAATRMMRCPAGYPDQSDRPPIQWPNRSG